ncbi:transposase [Streptomyces sp. NPDC005799]|uniref:transposase n=1 Tax=Streptomyces sp. NPDC005799 TaxID=3154678 RepID=UPI0033CE4A01
MLFEVMSGSLAPPETPGVCYRRWRTVAFDGCSSIKAPDRPRLRTVLGKSRNQQGDASYPALRLTALCETGTRGLLAAVFGSCSVGELASATALLGHLNPKMLLLADRGFDADTFLSSVSDTGAQYLVRLRSSRRPLIETVLSDGSYLTHLSGRPVRIIVATVTAICADGKKVSDSYQLATTLLDPVNDPAGVLVRLYHERWEVESAFYALRHTLQDGRVLRSCDPAGLEQELWSSLIVYQLLRRAMTDAALGRPGTDPDRMSFTVALESARNQVTTASGIDGCEINPTAPGTIGGAVPTAQMPPRRTRLSIRKVKCSTSRYAGKADDDRAMTSTNVVRLAIDIHDGHIAFPSAPTYTPAQDEQLTASRSRRKEQLIQLLQTVPRPLLDSPRDRSFPRPPQAQRHRRSALPVGAVRSTGTDRSRRLHPAPGVGRSSPPRTRRTHGERTHDRPPSGTSWTIMEGPRNPARLGLPTLPTPQSGQRTLSLGPPRRHRTQRTRRLHPHPTCPRIARFDQR